MNEETPSNSAANDDGRSSVPPPAVANTNSSGSNRENASPSTVSMVSGLAESEREFRSYAIPILRRLALGEAAVCFAIILFASRTEFHPLPSEISIIAACAAIPACIALTAAHTVASYFGAPGLRFFDSGICRILAYGLSLVGGISTLVSFGGLLWYIHPFAAIAFGGATVIAFIVWSIMYSAIVLEMTEKAEATIVETARKSPQTGLPVDGGDL